MFVCMCVSECKCVCMCVSECVRALIFLLILESCFHANHLRHNQERCLHTFCYGKNRFNCSSIIYFSLLLVNIDFYLMYKVMLFGQLLFLI